MNHTKYVINFQRVIAFCLAVALAGCGSFSVRDYRKPSTLKKIDSPYQLSVKWTASGASSFQNKLPSHFFPLYHNGYFYATYPNGLIKIIDALTGNVVSKISIPKTELTCAVAIEHDKLFLGTKAAKILAWDIPKKEIVWQHNLTSLLLEPPLVVNNMLITKTSDGTVSGFSLVDGTLKYQHKTATPSFMIHRYRSLTSFGHTTFLLGMPSGYLEARDPQTGTKMLRLSVASPKGSSEFERAVDVVHPPLIMEHFLYVGAYQSKVMAFDLNTFKRHWLSNISTTQPIALLDSMIIATTEEGFVVALNRYTGEEIWRLKDLIYRPISGPVILEGKILIMDQAGFAYLVDPDTGQLIGYDNVGIGSLMSPPQSFGEGVLVQNSHGKLAYIVLEK